MTEPVRIRRFRLTDMSALLAIEQACFPGEAFDEALFRRFAAKGSALFLVALCGRRLVGYSLAERSGPDAELVSIAVAPELRRRGVGQALLGATLGRLRRTGCRVCRLSVRTTNTAAIRLYERHGFRRLRRIAKYYADGADALRMRKELAAPVRR